MSDRNHPIIRLESHQVSDLVIVVRCGKAFKLRFRLAMWLMRLAGKIGGFRGVKVARERPSA